MSEQYTARAGAASGPMPRRCGDAGPERLDDHVGALEERAGEGRRRPAARTTTDSLPAFSASCHSGEVSAHRVAARLLDANDPRAEPEELARRERPREVAGEIDDERPPERLHRARTYHYPATALTERAAGAEEKRRLILDAAVRVFARKGFHTSRVGDIAEEAGVAHGLLYHYFSSKDEVLETIFRENWGVLVERIVAVEQSDESARDQLRHVAAIILRTWRHEPDVVRVLVREIARSPEMQERIGDLVQADRGDQAHHRARPRARRVPRRPRPRARSGRVLRRHRRAPDRLGARPAAGRRR